MSAPGHDPLGKRALFSTGSPGPAPAVPLADGKRALFSVPAPRGALRVDCSACGARSSLTWGRFLLQHLPVWLWVPWRPRSRLMRCPSCGKLAWLTCGWPLLN